MPNMQFANNGVGNDAGAVPTTLKSTNPNWTLLVENDVGYGVAGTGNGGVRGDSTNDAAGVFGLNRVSGNGVTGRSQLRHGVYGQSESLGGAGVLAENVSGGGYGLWAVIKSKAGFVAGGVAVQAENESGGGYGLRAIIKPGGTGGGTAVSAENENGGGYGLHASIKPGGAGGGVAVFAENYNAAGLAGVFNGQVLVSGLLVKLGGGFKIDHPQAPEDRYLTHSFTESPNPMNIYDGIIATDEDSAATIELPGYFEALNRDFRYQLTVLGGEFAQAVVTEEVRNNRFSIRTDKPGVRVSWQVTGIRQDAWANAHRSEFEVEVDKPVDERGKYLSPVEHGLPASAGLFYTEPSASEENSTATGEQG
jgi:hypothetical protein